MNTIEQLPDGKWRINVFTLSGWIGHTFDTMEQLKKYAQKCYNQPKEHRLDVV